MNHPINPLNDEGLNMLNDRLTEISVALDDCRAHLNSVIPTISAREFDKRYQDVRAYLGTIREAQSVICDLLYGDFALLVGEGLIRDDSHDEVKANERVCDNDECGAFYSITDRVDGECPVCSIDPTLPIGCSICDPDNPDACPPQGIERPTLDPFDEPVGSSFLLTDDEAAALIEPL